MLKSMTEIVGALLLCSTILAPVEACAQAPVKDAADVVITVARDGEVATFELYDCEVRLSVDQALKLDTRSGVTTTKGSATIWGLRDGKQVFFMSVKNALITLKRRAGG